MQIYLEITMPLYSTVTDVLIYHKTLQSLLAMIFHTILFFLKKTSNVTSVTVDLPIINLLLRLNLETTNGKLRI